MRFHLLGDIQVWTDDGAPVPIGTPQTRAVLAALLLEPGRAVTADRLIRAVWDDAAPRSAAKNVQGFVHRLRKVLDGDPRCRLRTVGLGYQLDVDGSDIDLHEFRRLVGAACGADAADAAELLRRALALWHGPAMVDVSSRTLGNVAAGLDEERLTAVEDRVEAELTLGRHAQCVADLRAEVAAHPLRERLWTLLMLALFRSGRQAEALAAYRAARAALVEQLGVEPGPQMRDLHRRILAGDPGLVTRTDPTATTHTEPPRVDQLPHVLWGFIGRDTARQELDALLAAHRSAGGSVIAAVDGLAGVGKTSLVVQWAHRVGDDFPAGALYLDLRGYDPYQRPMSPSEALGHLLAAVGVPAAEFPDDLDARGRAFRTALGGRRWLVILDNATSAEQVRALLPGGSSCFTLVTSRTFLGGLVATEGAHRLALAPFTTAEGRQLLSTVVGPRAEAEPGAALSLVTACGRLPLALRIAAAQLVADPTRSIADLAVRLTDERPLDELRLVDDDRASVPATFDLSYAALSPPAQQTFLLLGALPARQVTEEAITATADATTVEVTAALAELNGSGLVTTLVSGHVGMHDLVRRYAAGRVRHAWTVQAMEAQRRLVAWYLAGARRAIAELGLPRLLIPPSDVPVDAGAGPSTIIDAPSARDWLETELADIVATICHVADRDPAPAVWLLALELRGFFRLRRYVAAWSEVGAATLRAAHAAGTAADRAAVHHFQGHVRWSTGDYDAAVEHYRQALVESRAAAWPTGTAGSLSALGAVRHEQGLFEQAIAYYHRALEQPDAALPATLRLITVGSLGLVHQTTGRPRAAIEAFTAALALAEQLHAVDHIATGLGNLGLSYLQLGDLDRARDLLDRALSTYRQVGSRNGEANVLGGLATLNAEVGRYDEATYQATLALRIARDIEDRRIECDALLAAGTVAHRRGELDGARLRLAEAVDAAQLIGYKRGLAPVMARLAAVELDLGEVHHATVHAHEALDAARRSANRAGEADALIVTARICLAGGAYDAAREHARAAMELCADSGLASQHDEATRVLGAVDLALEA